jgi:hypothetical protein
MNCSMASTKARVIGSAKLVERKFVFLGCLMNRRGPFQDLQPANDDIQVHPVDAFHF